MGNEKTSITAEFASIIRARKDPKNLYFVSKKSKILFYLLRKFISKKKLEEIFNWRVELSQKLDEKIVEGKPDQIIELAAGYSLRGFNLCLNNKNLIYISTKYTFIK